MENYSLLMGAAAVMKMAEMVVSMEKPSGGLLRSGRVPEQRLLSPRSWLRDGGGWKGEKFEWNEEADRAFEDLKRTISTPPILVAPKEKEPLMLYIAATPQVVSTVLVVEREEEGKPHSPAAELMPIPLSWPFAQCGLDMVGKLHKAWPGGYEYMLVAVDKFTKWTEAKPINSPDAASAVKFIKVSFSGLEFLIASSQTMAAIFTSKEFKAYCTEVSIKLHFASVAHPQTNGQVEKANGIICNGIKKRMLAPLEKSSTHMARGVA
ncbi:hypothetical protein QYE76_046027 [Lolium multiflorum]|uniref:Integrase catalytic domain-containing protein n=1 Tax=Lolium multiflorum TaxID=4521 RepID=A0AAD8TLD9_LOLMU|nr:hypothetical protein QYE76_046027 [Lolium multiflorum]